MNSILAMLLLSFPQEAAVREGKETLLCTVEQAGWLPKTLLASPDGKRVAYAVQEPDGFFWVIDGKPQKKFEKIGFLQFSPDSKRFLYSGGGKERTLVVDDKEYGPYEVVGFSTFSADGSRFGSLVRAGGQEFALIDGQEGPKYAQVGKDLLYFSPDSKRVLYQGTKEGKTFFVIDGKEGKAYDGVSVGPSPFSPDSARVAYTGREGEKRRMIVDGEEHRLYDALGRYTPVWSADSKRVAYSAKDGRQWCVVIDGKEEKKYGAIIDRTLVFAPDGRVAYGVNQGFQFHLVADQKEQGPYDFVFEDTVKFSPDGKRLACVAGKLNEGRRRAMMQQRDYTDHLLVVDGKPGKVYLQIARGSPVWSADGKRIAAMASKGDGKWTVVLDDEEKAYGDVQDLAFGPGNRLVYLIKDKAGFAVGVDGVPGKTYDQIPALKGRALPLIDGDGLRYVALAGKSVFLVEEKLK
jgi:Tol biopolymer transport system component